MSAQFANNIENNISERRNLLDISNEDEDDDGIEIRIDNHTTDYNINNEETPLINAHPDDKFNTVYIVLLLFGIASLLPWNVFITATDYFVNYKLNTTESFNTTYRSGFTFYVGIIGQTTNVVMNLFNILITLGGNPVNRIPYTIVLCSLVVVSHIALAIVDTSTWPFEFFVVTCASVFIMYVATGIMNSCIFYLAGLLPAEYMNALMIGSNAAGIFTSLASILSKLTTPNIRLAAIYYFIATFIVLLASLVGFVLMNRSRFYHFYIERTRNAVKSSLIESTSIEIDKRSTSYWPIIKKTWFMMFCIWLNFFSTLSIFPNFQLGVEQSDPNFIIPNYYFNDVVVFLTFNLLVTIGSAMPRFVRVPGPKLLPIPVIARSLLIFVFFALCNFKPHKRNYIPVLVLNDYVYWTGTALSAFFFGYFTSLLMMYTPKLVAQEHQGAASMIAAFVIAVGVMSGLYFYVVLEFIVLF